MLTTENTLTPHWGNLTRDTNTGTARVGTIVDGIDGHIVFRLSAGDVLSKQRIEEEIAITPALKEIFVGDEKLSDLEHFKHVRAIQASMNWAIAIVRERYIADGKFINQINEITIAVTYVDPDLMPYTEDQHVYEGGE